MNTTAIKKEDIVIGTKFIRIGKKRKDIETVYDIFKTYNNAGELVNTMYGVEHYFMGQIVRDTVNVITEQQEPGEILFITALVIFIFPKNLYKEDKNK